MSENPGRIPIEEAAEAQAASTAAAPTAVEAQSAPRARTASVVVASNRAAAGVYPDRTGPVIVEWLAGQGCVVGDPIVVPDGDPVAAARLSRCRAAIAELAERHVVLAQNLLASDIVRRLAWQPPQPPEEPAVRERLLGYGARPWQVELTAAALSTALAD